MAENQTIELLRRLSESDGVPGAENEVREVFEERWSTLGQLRYDRLGSAVLELPVNGSSPRVAVECHMDEVGFMVQAVTRAGLLKLVPLGGFWSQALPAQRVNVLSTKGTKIPGVISATPPHLLRRGDQNKAVDLKDLTIDIGAESKDEVAEWGIRPGCFVFPHSPFTLLAGQNRVAGKAFDNRVGCTVCIETLEEAARRGPGTPTSWPCTVIGMASVQEEVGLRGVRTNAEIADPDLALVVEGSPADDLTTSADESQGKLGKGVQIRAYDPTMVASSGLVDLALEVAEEESIPYQLAVRTSGGTNAGWLHLHRRGVPCLVVAVPVRYAHSHSGIIDLRDLDALRQLVWALLDRLDLDTFQKRILPWSK